MNHVSGFSDVRSRKSLTRSGGRANAVRGGADGTASLSSLSSNASAAASAAAAAAALLLASALARSVL